MIDLESLSLKPNAALVSIGAVMFDENGIHGELYIPIKLESNPADADVDVSTVAWWMNQSDDARRVFADTAKKWELTDALLELHNFIIINTRRAEDFEVWCNGADFDFSVLKWHYVNQGWDLPWNYKQQRDCRTLFALRPDIKDKLKAASTGTHHNAYDDAIWQAEVTLAILKEIQ
jgi:hypothetical protein